MYSKTHTPRTSSTIHAALPYLRQIATCIAMGIIVLNRKAVNRDQHNLN